ncbi:MAG TPA: hypothetical protein PKC28_05445 [Bdellovibrionales bacterium]|nr:hypothetical protein [Bdellovibrionales bacterium]
MNTFPNAEICLASLDPDMEREFKREKLESLLRHRDTNSSAAIRAIVSYLALYPEWDGERKFSQWQRFASVFTRGPSKYWINSPSLRTRDGDIVCWGETRGNLLIFTARGEIFIRINKNKPDPHGGSAYQIDWSDPELRRITPKR